MGFDIFLAYNYQNIVAIINYTNGFELKINGLIFA